MRARWCRTAVGWIALSLVVAACGGSGAPPAASQAVEDYFTAFGDGRYRVMLGLSTGPARLYAEYLVAGERSVNGPATAPPLDELVLGDAVMDGDRAAIDGEAVVGTEGGPTTFRDFELVRDGERWVVHDYLRDGRPLADYVVAADVKSGAQGLRVAADLVFRDPSSGTLALPITVTNDRAEAVRLRSYEARFTAEGSRRAHRIDFSGPGDIAAGDTIDLILVFDTVDDADGGGEVTLAFRERAGEVELTQPLVVPPFTAD